MEIHSFFSAFRTQLEAIDKPFGDCEDQILEFM